MSIKNNKKRGNTVLTMPFVLIISITILVVFSFFSINMIIPFVWYQKLQLTSNKYMYIIEKYGYLKEKEKENLLNDLINQGFDIKNIEIQTPTYPSGFGTLIEFNIKYSFTQKLPSWEGSLKMKTQIIPINVNKTIISKI